VRSRLLPHRDRITGPVLNRIVVARLLTPLAVLVLEEDGQRRARPLHSGAHLVQTADDSGPPLRTEEEREHW
jgi:hypothetical protein